jgi:FOG: LysM repeat
MNITKRQYVTISLFLLIAIGILYLGRLDSSFHDRRNPYFEYVVQQEDTCLNIAYTLGVSIVSIVEANDLIFDCSDIYPGQKLSIPYPTPTPFGFVEATYVVIDCEKVFYTVQEGDSVSSIASDYYIPKQAIRDFNGIEGDILTPDAEIVIPLCVRTPRYIDPTPTATLVVP